jgi:phosphoribosylformylglycinamidine synthase
MAVGGTVDQGSDTVNVQGLFTVSLDELGVTYEDVLPGLLG